VSLSNRTPASGGASRSHQRLGHGETGFPHPPPWGGFGRAAPSQEKPNLSLRGAAAWMSDVNIRGNRVSPTPSRMGPEVKIWGNRVSPPAVSLSNRTPACGAPGAPNTGGWPGRPTLRAYGLPSSRAAAHFSPEIIAALILLASVNSAAKKRPGRPLRLSGRPGCSPGGWANCA